MGDKTTETETLNKEVKVKDTFRLSSKCIKKYIYPVKYYIKKCFGCIF
jgi:hypothetical protein